MKSKATNINRRSLLISAPLVATSTFIGSTAIATSISALEAAEYHYNQLSKAMNQLSLERGAHGWSFECGDQNDNRPDCPGMEHRFRFYAFQEEHCAGMKEPMIVCNTIGEYRFDMDNSQINTIMAKLV